jgi:chromosome partitioning protein
MTGKVIVVAASKGGSSKSTVAANLAVRAMQDGQVVLVDWEPQGSLAIWWKLRGQPENPSMVKSTDDIGKDIAAAKATGADWVVVDTPPDQMRVIERAIRSADFVLIPCRVSLFDLAGIRPVIGYAQEHGKPFSFLLNAVNPGTPGWDRLIKSAASILKNEGPVMSKMIRERAAYIATLNAGRSGPEYSDTREAKAAAVEINAVWAAIKRAVRGSK